MDVTCLKCKKASFLSEALCLNENANTLKTVDYEWKAMQMGLGARKREKFCTHWAPVRYHTHPQTTQRAACKNADNNE